MESVNVRRKVTGLLLKANANLALSQVVNCVSRYASSVRTK